MIKMIMMMTMLTRMMTIKRGEGHSMGCSKNFHSVTRIETTDSCMCVGMSGLFLRMSVLTSSKTFVTIMDGQRQAQRFKRNPVDAAKLRGMLCEYSIINFLGFLMLKAFEENVERLLDPYRSWPISPKTRNGLVQIQHGSIRLFRFCI